MPFPTIEDFSDPGIELMSLESPALAGGFFTTVPPRKPLKFIIVVVLVTQCLTLCSPTDCSLPGSLSMRFFRQEYWIGLPFRSPEDLPNPGAEPGSSEVQADSLLSGQ